MSLENWDKVEDKAANEGQAAHYIASTEEVTPASVAAAYGIREESIRRAPSAHLPPLFIPPVNKRICGTIIGTHYMERRSGKSGDRKARDKVLVIEVDLDEPIPELGIEKGPAAMAGYHVVLVDELIRSARLLFIKSIKDEIAGVERELKDATSGGDGARAAELRRRLEELNARLANADVEFMRAKLNSILVNKHICVRRLPRVGQAYPYEVQISP
jgi:hypothetical protein